MVKAYITALEEEYSRQRNSEIAAGQQAYLKNKFAFFGIKTEPRRAISAVFLEKTMLPPYSQMRHVVKHFWNRPEREFHHFAQELMYAYRNQFQESDLELIEYLITHQSWWDTVDFVAPKLVGPYFLKYPHQRDPTIKNWLSSNHIWLQRSAVLFQLKYKKDFDATFLTYVIQALTGSKEFFINKAIGWALREYGKQNPAWVLEFVSKNPNLSSLSRKEALRRL